MSDYYESEIECLHGADCDDEVLRLGDQLYECEVCWKMSYNNSFCCNITSTKVPQDY